MDEYVIQFDDSANALTIPYVIRSEAGQIELSQLIDLNYKKWRSVFDKVFQKWNEAQDQLSGIHTNDPEFDEYSNKICVPLENALVAVENSVICISGTYLHMYMITDTKHDLLPYRISTRVAFEKDQGVFYDV